jgi:putative endonuclease
MRRFGCCWLRRRGAALCAWLGRISGRRRRTLGDRGERLVERYLRRQGMTIVGRQVRLGGGELDLVAVDGRTIVFVEVKTRQSDAAGHPLEAVSAEKQRRLTRAALTYLRRHDLLDCAARFDLAAVLWPETAGRAGRPQLVYVRNAIEPLGPPQMFV